MDRALHATCLGQVRPPPAALILFPAAMYLARSYSTSFLGFEAPPSTQGDTRAGTASHHALALRGDPARHLVTNAHVILQRLIGRLPAPLLSWVFTKVLNLPEEISQQTIHFLRRQIAQAGVPSANPEPRGIDRAFQEPDTGILPFPSYRQQYSLAIENETASVAAEEDILLLAEADLQPAQPGTNQGPGKSRRGGPGLWRFERQH